MSVSHCMGQALRIARRPPAEWEREIAGLPDACEHADCGAPKSCRERCGAYLRKQAEMLRARPKGRGKR